MGLENNKISVSCAGDKVSVKYILSNGVEKVESFQVLGLNEKYDNFISSEGEKTIYSIVEKLMEIENDKIELENKKKDFLKFTEKIDIEEKLNKLKKSEDQRKEEIQNQINQDFDNAKQKEREAKKEKDIKNKRSCNRKNLKINCR